MPPSAASAQARAYRQARQVGDDERRSACSCSAWCRPSPPASRSRSTRSPAPTRSSSTRRGGLAKRWSAALIDPDEFRVSKRDGDVLSRARLGRRTATTGTSTLSHDAAARRSARCCRASSSTTARRRTSSGATTATQFWIVQSRPVTTARRRSEPRTQNRRIRRSESEPNPNPNPQSEPDVEWTRANLAEVLPDQMSPQALGVYEDMLNRGQRHVHGPPAGAGRPSSARCSRRSTAGCTSTSRRCGASSRDGGGAGGRHAAIARALRGDSPGRRDRRRAPPLRRVAALPAGFHPPRQLRRARRAPLATRTRAHARDILRALTAVDPRDAVRSRRSGRRFSGGSRPRPTSIQAVFVMSGVLLREDCAQQGLQARRVPLRAAGVSAARGGRAVGEHAAGVRSRRAGDVARATSRGDAVSARERRHVRRLPHRARRHDVPRAVRSVPRSLRPSRPLRVGLGAAAAARESRAGALRDPVARCRHGRRTRRRSPSGRKRTPRRRGARSRRGSRCGSDGRCCRACARCVRRLKKQYVWREQVRSDLTRVVRYACAR